MNALTSYSRKVEAYVNYRRSLGYSLRVEARELHRFARYVDDIGHKGPLTVDLVLGWARSASACSELYQARRVETVRGFARYLAAFETGTQVPPRGLLGRAHRRIQPYIYSPAEILKLMQAARQLSPLGGLRPRTYETLIGLLASTGLRVCEALKLERDDVDLDLKRLFVRETKFHKSRLVPIHETVSRQLEIYARLRDTYRPTPQCSRYFLSERGTALLPSIVHYTFQKLRQVLGSSCKEGRRSPRLYDLRHTFASRRLLMWYQQGVDVEHAIFHLSTYLGHVKPSDTYWYLSGIPDLMAVAGKRFETFAGQVHGGGGTV